MTAPEAYGAFRAAVPAEASSSSAPPESERRARGARILQATASRSREDLDEGDPVGREGSQLPQGGFAPP